MKNTRLSLFFALLCAAFLTGCVEVDVCSQGKDMVAIRNSGCFLLGIVPLFSGDPEYPNQQVCNWFDNTVTLETNIRLLNEEFERQGAADIRNLASHPDDEWIWLIFKRRSYKTSAELVR